MPLKIDKGNPGETVSFSEVVGATTYRVYAGTLASLQAGTYDHGPLGGICGITDAVTGDGSVTAVATLPENDYFLAVAANSAGESGYGTSTAGPIPAATTTCP